MKIIEIQLREDFDMTKLDQVRQVFNALVSTGGLTGVRGGQTIIHFDADGNFQGVQLSYWPWRRKKL